MRAGEIRIKIKALMGEAQMWSDILEKKSCNDCTNFYQSKCHKFDAEPPPEVVKVGCEEWNWDEIPFN